MIGLKIGQTLLNSDIEAINKEDHHKQQTKLLNDIALALNLSPSNYVVQCIYNALSRNVKVLQTDNTSILKFANVIEKQFHMRILCKPK